MKMNYLPNKLLKLRKHYNYSQSFIAETLGVDVVEYMAYENGRAVPDYAKCKKLASLYRINVIEIFKNNEEVTLHKIDLSKTEEINLNYFLPNESFNSKVGRLFKKYYLVIIGIMLLMLCIIPFALKDKSTPTYNRTLENINRLSVSDTSVVYIDDKGAVKGTGDNSNGQLSSLPSSDAIKVVEGSNYTIILNSDGTVTSIGLNQKYSQEIEKWKDIIDVASGDNHVVGLDVKGRVYAVGDNSSGQCDVNDENDVKKVYAFKNATVLLLESGKLYCSGYFTGQSQMKNYENILDIDASSDNLVLLTESNTVEYFAAKKNFLDIYKWRDVIDVACGDEFIAALKKDGTVYIDCEDEQTKKEVSTWTNIIAISAADEYLIAYDGENIKGVGKNDYLQFEKNEERLTTLAQVAGVRFAFDESGNKSVSVSFDKVTNASGYEVTLNIDDDSIAHTYRVSSNQTVVFESENLNDGESYEILITTLGDEVNYANSKTLSVTFTYQKSNDQTVEEYIDVNFDYSNMNVTELETYLQSIGVTNYTGVDVGQECEDNSRIILNVNGISSGQRYSKSELSKANVTYEYCQIRKDDTPSGEQNEQDVENKE